MPFKDAVLVKWRGATAVNKVSKTMAIFLNRVESDGVIRLELDLKSAKSVATP